MAATWTFQIEVTDLNSKLVSIAGTRTDGEDVRTYVLSGVSVDTHDTPLGTIKTTVVDKLYGMYLAAIDKELKIAVLLSGWEAALATALNAKES